ncbi:MAG: glycosyltransferase family 4 protein [Candidatus Hydrogenedentota bacterium]
MLTTTTAIVLLFIGFLVVTAALMPGVMLFARTIGAIDRGGYRKIYKGAMPLLGGLGIAVPFIAAGLGSGLLGYFVISHWQWVVENYPAQFNLLMNLAGNRHELLTMTIGAVGIIGIGVIDDSRGLRPRWKLLGQTAVALFICASGYAFTKLTIPFWGSVDLGFMGGHLLTMLWVIGLINAFNLVDGTDGLAGGIAFIAAIALLMLSLIQANPLVALASAALAGSLLAFLGYNFPPARIFLGDTGSMFLGYALAVMSLLGAQKAETAAILFAPMLVLGLPVFETLVSIIRRYLNGVPVFAGDNRHTHHRLLIKGFTPAGVVLTLCGAEFCLAATAVLAALIPDESAWAWTPYIGYFATLLGLIWIAEYGRPQTVGNIMERRNRNRIYQALGKYAALRLNDAQRPVEPHLLLELCRQELGLSRIVVDMPEHTQWAAPPDAGAQTPPTRAHQECLHLKSSQDEDIVITYCYTRPPDTNLHQDVTACLAAIFNGLHLDEAAPGETMTGDTASPHTGVVSRALEKLSRSHSSQTL